MKDTFIIFVMLLRCNGKCMQWLALAIKSLIEESFCVISRRLRVREDTQARDLVLRGFESKQRTRDSFTSGGDV